MVIEFSAEARATYQDLSPFAVEFIDYVAEEPAERSRRIEFPTVELPDFIQKLAYPMQSWPIFLGPAKRAEIERATLGVVRLVKSLPERLFAKDPQKLDARYELGGELAAAFLFEPPDGISGAIGRCDFVDTTAGFKCIELNMSVPGGWQIRYWRDKYLSSPPMAPFLAERGLTATMRDPWEELFSHIVEEARRSPVTAGGTLNLALVIAAVDTLRDQRATEALNESFQRVLARDGGGLTGHLSLASYPNDFEVKRGMELYLGGKRIHTVLEYSHLPTPQEVYLCFKAETILLFNGPVSRLLGDKRNLALLSEHAESDLFDREERALIAASIPWTRVARPGKTTWRGEERPLDELLVEHQEEMVLKLAAGTQGIGVVVGSRVSPQVWSAAIRTALDAGGTWLAQEAAVSRPYLCQIGEVGACEHDVVWGTFAFGTRYGGGFLRMVPRGTGDGIINAARGATEGVLLEL
jgi:hypothetical protein